MRSLILLAILFATPSASCRAGASRRRTPQLQAMLAALLVERFGLRIRHEPRALPVFLLTLARSDGRLGPALRRAGVACEPITRPPGIPPRNPRIDSLPVSLTLANIEGRCPTMSAPGWMAGRAITMAQLAARLTPFAGRPVIDRTNLAGESLFTAVREQLGLALKPARAPVEVIVIDGVQRPTEN